tara:strand:+ start:387 stop:563 length:177 start_codon:yes stop_codon:yes gene_type:complete
MKIYTLTIVYNDKDEEVEYIEEELRSDNEAFFEDVDLTEYLDENDKGIPTSFNIVGEA